MQRKTWNHKKTVVAARNIIEALNVSILHLPKHNPEIMRLMLRTEETPSMICNHKKPVDRSEVFISNSCRSLGFQSKPRWKVHRLKPQRNIEILSGIFEEFLHLQLVLFTREDTIGNSLNSVTSQRTARLNIRSYLMTTFEH
jgi:hypothetical protein